MLHESNNQLIINGVAFPLADFQALEPDYTPAPAGWVRFWGPDCQFLSDGSTQQPDALYTPARLSLYESRLPAYQLAQEATDASILWIHCTIGGGEPGHLYPFIEQGSGGLDFHFEVKDRAGAIVTWLSGKWGIQIFYAGENRRCKVKSVQMENGVGNMNGYNDNKASGNFDIRESTFAPVTLPDGRTFTFKLAQPIIFTVSEG
jgi:hypothetical protein